MRTIQRVKETNHSYILANDPSFTAWGFSIIRADNTIVKTGCIKTEPLAKKQRIRKGDDRTRRTLEIINYLQELLNDYNIKLIVAELPHGSQNAQAAIMMGIVVGILQGVSAFTKIPIEWYSEADAKKAVLKKQSATKDEMIKAIDKLYKVVWTKVKYKDEAIADSIAIFHAASRESSIIQFLKNA